MRVWLAWPQYVLAYAPQKSPAGSCHQIQVKVERANLEVWTRSEYCNTDHPASDPLIGTEFGKQLQAKANPGTLSDIDLKMKVWAFAIAGGRTAGRKSASEHENHRHGIRHGSG